jgi:hypothetical protein
VTLLKVHIVHNINVNLNNGNNINLHKEFHDMTVDEKEGGIIRG